MCRVITNIQTKKKFISLTLGVFEKDSTYLNSTVYSLSHIHTHTLTLTSAMCCCLPLHYTRRERFCLGCMIIWLISAAVCVGLAFSFRALITYLIQSHIYDAALLDSQVRHKILFLHFQTII